MDEQTGFLQAIIERPEEDTHRLAFADQAQALGAAGLALVDEGGLAMSGDEFERWLAPGYTAGSWPTGRRSSA